MQLHFDFQVNGRENWDYKPVKLVPYQAFFEYHGALFRRIDEEQGACSLNEGEVLAVDYKTGHLGVFEPEDAVMQVGVEGTLEFK